MNKTPAPQAEKAPEDSLPPDEDKPGTNATQHHPDPKAEPMVEGDPKYQRRSPYITGND